MRLTPQYSRIAAPHDKDCPWCGIEIADWFMEWYPKEQYDKIRDNQIAMDCPNCRKPVMMLKAKLYKALNGVSAVLRTIAGAEEWMKRTYDPHPDLVSFLVEPAEQPRTKYFRSGYWENINV